MSSNNSECKEAFCRLLLNGPLEEHSDALYNASQLYYISPTYLSGIEADKSSFVRDIHKCLELVTILADLRNGQIYWRDEIYSDIDIPISLIEGVQDTLLDLIEVIHSRQVMAVPDASVVEDAVRAKWCEVTDLLPGIIDLDFDERKLITNDSFDSLLQSIAKCNANASKLFSWTKELMITAFLDSVEKTGVKLNNSVYREVYKCLEFLGWIDPEQLRSHNLNSARDAKERFIRAKFNRLKEKGFDFNDFIVSVIDTDWYDPRK